MKVKAISLLFLILFGGVFLLKGSFRSPFIAKKTLETSLANPLIQNQSGSEADSHPGELFQFLFSPEFSKKLEEPPFLKLLAARLSQPMPSQGSHHASKYQRALREKIGILQALRDLNPQSLSQKTKIKIRTFLIHFLLNSRAHWMTERLALQGVSKFGGFESEQERGTILNQVDPRAISLAALSDQKLIEETMSHEN